MNKQLLTMTIGMLCGASAFAQVEFVDAKGEIIPNGSTVIRNEIETPVDIPGLGSKNQIASGISAKNTSSAPVTVQTQMNSTDLPFGQISLCFPNSCWISLGNFTGPYPTHKPATNGLSADGPWTSPTSSSIKAGEKISLQTEWLLNSLGKTTFNKDTDKGSVTVTYSLLVGGNAVTTIKVIYTTDQNAATGISDAAANAATAVGYYNAAGQKCTSASNGITIVKYSDGSTRKVINK